ncbi:MAG: hypothetical protein AUH06_05350 [Gemmatimonadetes bacterium 13_2_20CM_69_27]|nr:MAG: hypothetical protein AUH06_05350 [Gemmatimonadetes bacterium 13_2_20CM_69_27]OLB50883.1 MAG: hypothetical protein AUI13_15090 [Gemmatimonadetes bacterium 13_2_20CM_2_69_23]PYO32004.1 MAG: hypothetical protein DMD32_06885 [Gemmatimonadota bacterium]PYP23443.1 MAG: hypothetical protein DMD51_14305 [Gemmatimonadota bacterium]
MRVTDLRALLEEISVARLVGTPNHARVREILKRELGARGFVVLEQRFRSRPRAPLWGRAASDAVNLIAVRPRARVTAWLTAHYDSKGQPVSMAARLVLAGVVVAGVLGALAARVAGGPTLVLALPVPLVALFVALSRVSDDSPGAVDNGSGVVTVLATVDALPADATVGVVFPDAEEHGLVGARALVRERANLFANTALINFDGIDDRGRTIALVHRRGPLVDAVVHALTARRARLLPVLEDGLVLARSVRECVTVMRGCWETARVVHTPGDTAERLTLVGVAAVAHAVATALQGGNERVDVTRCLV